MKFFIKIILVLIFCLYLAILTKLILFKYIPLTAIIQHFNFTYHEYHWRSSNFTPFKTIIFYLFLADVNLNIRIENLAGNIIGFAPLGFILPLISKRFQKLSTATLAAFSLSLTFEILQLLFELGSFDVDDVILNTFGGVAGFLSLKLVLLVVRSRVKRIDNRASV
jgi:glycopeptide antibiotics resistance protein